MDASFTGYATQRFCFRCLGEGRFTQPLILRSLSERELRMGLEAFTSARQHLVVTALVDDGSGLIGGCVKIGTSSYNLKFLCFLTAFSPDFLQKQRIFLHQLRNKKTPPFLGAFCYNIKKVELFYLYLLCLHFLAYV